MATNSANNVAISPVNLLWQIEAEECIDLSTVSSYDGTSFELYEVDGTKVIVAFDLDGGSVLPTPGAGERLLEVDVTTGNTLLQNATALQAALDGDADFSAVLSGNLVVVQRVEVGSVQAPADVDSGATITVQRSGKNYNAGLIQGDIELSVAPATFIVQAQQSGVTPLASLFQGYETLECTSTLLETTFSQLEEIYGFYGGSTGSGATKVFGAGLNKLGNNLLIDAGRLVLRPVNAVDNTEDTVLMLAVPVPDSLVFSGENPRTLSVTWQGFADLSADSRYNAVAFGDLFQ